MIADAVPDASAIPLPMLQSIERFTVSVIPPNKCLVWNLICPQGSGRDPLLNGGAYA
jgi:hypothetical protein